MGRVKSFLNRLKKSPSAAALTLKAVSTSTQPVKLLDPVNDLLSLVVTPADASRLTLTLTSAIPSSALIPKETCGGRQIYGGKRSARVLTVGIKCAVILPEAETEGLAER